MCYDAAMSGPPVIDGRLPPAELQAEMLRSIMLYGQALVGVGDDFVAVTRAEHPRSMPQHEGIAAWAARYSTEIAGTPSTSSDGTS